jgi:tetratricopeptide (TPR) repeat protein
MKRLIVLTLAVMASTAGAQDLTTYNKALSAYNGNNFDESAKLFYDVYNTTTDNDLRLKSEYYLASSFQRQNLPFTAFIYFAPIVKAGPKHPFHLKAVEALITVQESLSDDYLIPSLLNNLYDRNADAWATLPLEVLARINYLIGRISHRKAKLDEAKQFLEAVPDTSQVYAKAQYLMGVALVDPRYPATNEEQRKKNLENAVTVFTGVTKIDPRAKQKDLLETQQLAYLALGRTNYGAGEFAKAVSAYERIPRFSKYWDQALFENGFARFQNDDLGGALGSLQALHAPQFNGAFQPESWVLKSTVYYFACLYEESKAALKEFENLYLPMVEKLRPYVEGEPKSLDTYFKLVNNAESDTLPRPVLTWVRSNERMLGVFSMLSEIEVEKKAIDANQGWKAAKLSAELTTYLDQNKGTLEQVAGSFAKSRLLEASRTVKGFADQAEIIRFEVAKAGKEIAETGMNQQAVLEKQTLYRPATPAENWNYWKFEGEFWRDEIGYYQYTLKRGCPAQ